MIDIGDHSTDQVSANLQNILLCCMTITTFSPVNEG